MLQLRASLPDSMMSGEDLTEEATNVMLMLSALLEKYDITGFHVVRVDKP